MYCVSLNCVPEKGTDLFKFNGSIFPLRTSSLKFVPCSLWSNLLFCFKNDFRVWANLNFLVIIPTHPKAPPLVFCLPLIFLLVCLYLPPRAWQTSSRTGVWEGGWCLFSSFRSQLHFSWSILSSSNTEGVALTELFLDVKFFHVVWEDSGEAVYYTVSLVCSYTEVLKLQS